MLYAVFISAAGPLFCVLNVCDCVRLHVTTSIESIHLATDYGVRDRYISSIFFFFSKMQFIFSTQFLTWENSVIRMREILWRAISIICKIYEHHQSKRTHSFTHTHEHSQAQVSGIWNVWDNYFRECKCKCKWSDRSQSFSDHHAFGIPFEFVCIVFVWRRSSIVGAAVYTSAAAFSLFVINLLLSLLSIWVTFRFRALMER